jgi:hypothetical protein
MVNGMARGGENLHSRRNLFSRSDSFEIKMMPLNRIFQHDNLAIIEDTAVHEVIRMPVGDEENIDILWG